MSGYNSPLGSKNYSGENRPMRNFDIPDEGEGEFVIPQYDQSNMVAMNADEIRNFANRINGVNQQENTAQIEAEIRAAREAKRTGKVKISEGGKKRIEMLLGMTRMTRVTVIDGMKFVFQTLKSKEAREVLRAAIQFNTKLDYDFEVRRQSLAYSLVEVSNIGIEQFIDSNLFEDKLNFIDELDESVTSRLFAEYLVLTNESEKKYSINNKEQVEEVVADLKK